MVGCARCSAYAGRMHPLLLLSKTSGFLCTTLKPSKITVENRWLGLRENADREQRQRDLRQDLRVMLCRCTCDKSDVWIYFQTTAHKTCELVFVANL